MGNVGDSQTSLYFTLLWRLWRRFIIPNIIPIKPYEDFSAPVKTAPSGFGILTMQSLEFGKYRPIVCFYIEKAL